jgi:hypothetical protein
LKTRSVKAPRISLNLVPFFAKSLIRFAFEQKPTRKRADASEICERAATNLGGFATQNFQKFLPTN